MESLTGLASSYIRNFAGMVAVVYMFAEHVIQCLAGVSDGTTPDLEGLQL
jgi:hypothetical protein